MEDEGDAEFEDYEAITMHTPLPETNMGFRLLAKMGWKKGTGLGKNKQGRHEPVPILEKRETMGIGRMELEVETASKTTESRRLLDVEMEQTPELLLKKKEQADKEEALKKELKEMNEVFLCEDCNKQYTKVSDWENHLSSYDHHHRKRLKELKDRESKRNNDQDRKREKRKADKELERIYKMAETARSKTANPPQQQQQQQPQQQPESDAMDVDEEDTPKQAASAADGLVRKTARSGGGGGFTTGGFSSSFAPVGAEAHLPPPPPPPPSQQPPPPPSSSSSSSVQPSRVMGFVSGGKTPSTFHSSDTHHAGAATLAPAASFQALPAAPSSAGVAGGFKPIAFGFKASGTSAPVIPVPSSASAPPPPPPPPAEKPPPPPPLQKPPPPAATSAQPPRPPPPPPQQAPHPSVQVQPAQPPPPSYPYGQYQHPQAPLSHHNQQYAQQQYPYQQQQYSGGYYQQQYPQQYQQYQQQYPHYPTAYQQPPSHPRQHPPPPPPDANRAPMKFGFNGKKT